MASNTNLAPVCQGGFGVLDSHSQCQLLPRDPQCSPAESLNELQAQEVGVRSSPSQFSEVGLLQAVFPLGSRN